MVKAVQYDGKRYAEHRFRIPHDLWDEVLDWCRENNVYPHDASTMLHAIITIRDERDAVQFRLRWDGETGR
jgi:hypothetical protein